MAVASVAGDPRFFTRSGPYPLAVVAAASGGIAVDTALELTGVAPLQTAGPFELSFLDNRRYAGLLAATRAGAVIVHPALAARVPEGCVAIVTREPYLGWARAAALFFPVPPVRPGIHPSAVVDDTASIDPTAEIGPLAWVDAGAVVGPRCRVASHASIGAGVVLGPDCRIGAHVSLTHALLGARVTIFAGARIGEEGFGFATGPAGFVTVPQIGRVVIEDDAEIGANTTIDRGAAQDTVIGAGSRLDNQVMIGHNVRLGRCCVLVSQVGVSGSTVLGDFVQVAGQAGFSGHLTIGSKVRIGGQAGVMTDVPDGADYIGAPAMPARVFWRRYAALQRLAERRGDGVAGEARGGDAPGGGGSEAGGRDGGLG